MRVNILMILILCSCEGTDEIFIEEEPSLEECNSHVVELGRYYQKDDREFLSGGEDSTTHFDITNWSLNPCYLGNGLGRENFHALVQPEYVRLSEVKDNYNDTMDAVLLLTDGEPKVYPFNILRQHELLNDVVRGVPVMIVYCYLADLVAVYNRTYCGEVLTFAVSGYTYRDPNRFGALESFILWDRNSESLWWPINDKGVSGVFQGTSLQKYNLRSWGRTTMGEIKETYPNALVIKAGQTLDGPPANIPKADGC